MRMKCEDEMPVEMPKGLKPYYFEILFSINVAPDYMNEIISEIISEEISKAGEGVEFLSKNNIKFRLKKSKKVIV